MRVQFGGVIEYFDTLVLMYVGAHSFDIQVLLGRGRASCMLALMITADPGDARILASYSFKGIDS